MAEAAMADVNSLSALLEDLDCSVCFESQQLLLLPCQHRLCGTCIDKLSNSNIKKIVQCPECRRKYKLPIEGFPVCRLSQAVREQVEKAIHKSNKEDVNESPLTSPVVENVNEKDFKVDTELTCEQCSRDLECRCCYCRRFLCYRCIVKTTCKDSADQERHLASADIEYVIQEADNALSTWKYCIYKELEEIKNAKDKKTKKAVVVATEDVIDLETDPVERIQMIEQITKTDVLGKSLEPESEPNKSSKSDRAVLRENSVDQQNTLTDKIAQRVSRKSAKQLSKLKKNSVGSPFSKPDKVQSPSCGENKMVDSGIQMLETDTSETEFSRAKALYTFNQTEIGDGLIAISEDEEFAVLYHGKVGSDEQGWTKIRKDSGETGLVPTGYIQ